MMYVNLIILSKYWY